MNISDFVILPGSKTGTSLKLKAKSVQELQVEKVQLEFENKEMEKKLQQLQANMNREKQEREEANGYHWKSGQSGPGTQTQLLSQNKENFGKVSSGKVKLRLLKEQIQAPEPAKQPLAHKVANAAASEKPKVKRKTCGQCETKNALLVCLECGEDYCPSCFARVHQKGALKLHRTTSLQAKAYIPAGKLEAAQQFLKQINLDDSNGQIHNDRKKEVNRMSEDSLDVPSPLPTMPTYNIKDASTKTTAIRPESQNGESLLHGTFDEEESAKSFQEALNRWRIGSPSQKPKEDRFCQVGPGNPELEHPQDVTVQKISSEGKPTTSLGTCEVQTYPPVVKKNMDIEFKEDSLKYMERLLLKKHRRTPVEKLPDVVIEGELNLEKPLINQARATGVKEEEEEEEEDDIMIARFAAEEMKKYWVGVCRPEEPEAVLLKSEPSLKIKILEDACKEELEESANFVVMEAGSDEMIDGYSGTMSENQKTEPDIFLAQAGDITTMSPLSSAVNKENCLTFLHDKHEEAPRDVPSMQSEITASRPSSEEEIVPSTPYGRAIVKEKGTKTKNNGALLSSEQTSSLPELPLSKPCPVIELLKDCERSPELNETSPVTTKSSMLLKDVALREKYIRAPYRGLEGFFMMDTRSQQVPIACLCAVKEMSPSPSSSISFSGSEEWTRHFSFSECADESVVQDVLKRELRRPSSRLRRQSTRPRASLSITSIENASPRPFSANSPYCGTIKNSPRPSSALQTRPRSSVTWPLSRAASEISEIEGIDVTEHDDPFLEYSTDQQALADLESELQSNADPLEKLSDLTSGDLSAFNRHSKMTSQNHTHFHNNREIKDCSRDDTIRVCNESHTDDEEDLWRDKQQVIELC